MQREVSVVSDQRVRLLRRCLPHNLNGDETASP